MEFLKVCTVIAVIFVQIHGKPGPLTDIHSSFHKSERSCEIINRWGFAEEGKVWYDTCPPCGVCGANELGGAVLESQNWCISKTGGNDICRSDCGCRDGTFRHNITRTHNNIEEIVEICISALRCADVISAVKCPEGQSWDQQAPFCTRTCNNTLGLHNDQPCPKLWRPRCICPFNKPIWHKNECIEVDKCPK